ncbi:MAG: GGDEF domain-containing protein, partial [Pseudomonadales bacterium]
KAIGTAGDFSLIVVDATSNDGPATEDQVTFTSSFTGPNDKEYTIKVDRVLHRGPHHTFLGGVGTNFVHHGRTGIGFKMMPQLFAYVAFWGVAELSIDGEVVASNRFIHAMLTDNVRETGYRLAFDEGVDDFLNKANLRAQLLPRVIAAQRLAGVQNELLRTNKLLRKKIRDLQTTDLVDPVTGLGNLKFTLERISDTIKHAETRGGAACILLVGINNLSVIEEQYEESIIDELMSGIGAKVRQLVRPLDVVTRPEANMFAVITVQPNVENCTSQSFRRIFDNLYMHSFKTSDGYIPVVVGVSICAADAETGFPQPKLFMRNAYDGLTRSFDTGLITIAPLDAPSTQLS